MARTKDFTEIVAVKFEKQKLTTAADLYGGANAVAVGADNQILYKTCVILDGVEKVVDEAINGTQANNSEETVALLPTVEIEADLYDAGNLPLIVAGMGWEALDGPKTSGALKAHLIPFNVLGQDQRDFTTAEQTLIGGTWGATDKVNLGLHVAQDSGPSTKHAKNAYFDSMEISSQAMGMLGIKLSGTAEVNTLDATHATVSSWTKKATSFISRWKHYQSTATFGAIGGSQTVVQILDFSIKATRGMAKDNVPTGTGNGGKARAEPLATGRSEVTLDFTIHKDDTDQWRTWQIGDTLLQFKNEFVSGLKKLGFYFPQIQITALDAKADNGSSVTVSCRAFLPVGVDPFATERTFGTPWALPFVTPFYIISVDTDTIGYMRQS
jgi:hypothetical protein